MTEKKDGRVVLKPFKHTAMDALEGLSLGFGASLREAGRDGGRPM